jgi:predicted nucleotidyltransferase
MGKIFTPNEIQSQAYPSPGAHTRVAEEIIEFICDWHEDDPDVAPRAAMVHGSVVFGNDNIRSDVDVLAVRGGEGDELDVLTGMGKYIGSLARRTFIPIEISVISEEDIRSRAHPITEDIFFAEHLTVAARSTAYLCGDMGDMLRPLGEYADSEEQQAAADRMSALYVSIKKNEFFKSMTIPDQRVNYYKLQRAVELPSALGRKLVRLAQIRANAAHTNEPIAPTQESEHYTRQAFADGVLALAADCPQWSGPANQLLDLDGEYEEVLQSTLSGESSIDSYTKWVSNAYKVALEQALRLTVSTSFLLQKLGSPAEVASK